MRLHSIRITPRSGEQLSDLNSRFGGNHAGYAVEIVQQCRKGLDWIPAGNCRTLEAAEKKAKRLARKYKGEQQ